MKTPPSLDRVALLPTDADTKIADGALVKQGPIPIFMPDGAFLKPGVLDAFESTPHGGGEWYPNSHRTRLLLAALHAAKDIATYARGIDENDPWKDKRSIALFATPLVSMCDRTKELCDRLGQENQERSSWPAEDRALLQEAGRRLKKHQIGPVRTLRHKHTAHIDLDTLRPDAARIDSLQGLILPPLADTLLLLALCFNYRRVYTWRRRPPGAAADEIEIMTEYPIAMRAKLDATGSISALSGHSTVAEDPRGPLRDTVFGLFDVYNLLASKAEPPHRTIGVIERDDA